MKMSKKFELKLTNQEIDALRGAIYTQLDIFRIVSNNGKLDREAKHDLKLLKKILKRIGG